MHVLFFVPFGPRFKVSFLHVWKTLRVSANLFVACLLKCLMVRVHVLCNYSWKSNRLGNRLSRQLLLTSWEESRPKILTSRLNDPFHLNTYFLFLYIIYKWSSYPRTQIHAPMCINRGCTMVASYWEKAISNEILNFYHTFKNYR